MFFSDPSFDLKLSLVLLGISLLAAVLFWLKTRKTKTALLLFSILGNLSFLVNIGSRMFVSYDIKWLGYLSLFFWLPVNIYLLVRHFSKK